MFSTYNQAEAGYHYDYQVLKKSNSESIANSSLKKKSKKSLFKKICFPPKTKQRLDIIMLIKY